MGHNKYRICLLMVAVAATVGGILYYCFCIKEDETMEKGTLVKQMQQTGEKLKEAGRSVKEDMAQAFSSSGRTIKETAVEIKEDMEDVARTAKEDIEDKADLVKDDITVW